MTQSLVPQQPVTQPLSAIASQFPVIQQYFDALNGETYPEAASLFEEAGVLRAPFEQPVQGREAIAAYLSQEARGMVLQPDQGTVASTAYGAEITIQGKVQTRLFKVNVAWIFEVVSARSALASVQVKLLASPQELLKLRR